MSQKGLIDIEPVNTRRVDGELVKDHYSYGIIHSADVPEDFEQQNVDIEVGVKNVRWEYEGKCPILITPLGVKANEGVSMKEAQNQAFFALSILADEGYVSHWEKK